MLGSDPAGAARVEISSPGVATRRGGLGRALGWLALGLGLLPLAVMMVGGGVFGMDKPAHWADIVSASWIAACVTGVAGLGFRLAARKRPAKLRIEDGALSFEHAGSSRTVRREEIAFGLVIPAARGARLELELGHGTMVSVDVDDVAQADRVLDAMGLDASRRAYRLRPDRVLARVGATSVAFFATLLLAAFLKQSSFSTGSAFAPWMAGLAWLATSLPLLAGSQLLTSALEVTVGVDGLTLRRAGRSRFVAFEAMRSIRAQDSSLELTPLEGPAERLALRGVDAAHVAALDLRIKAALAARAGAAEPAAKLSLIARGGRSIAAWRDALVELARRGAGYRQAALSPEDLEGILASAESSAEQRIGAALGLTALAGAETRADAQKRVRVAAGACASPRVRVALEKVIDDELDEEGIEEALAEESDRGA